MSSMRSLSICTAFTLSAVLLLSFTHCGPSTNSEELRVFVCVGLMKPIKEIAELYQASTGERIAFNFASSGMLATQIIAGAPADVYFSANRAWMDEVIRSGKTQDGRAVEIASNRLVVLVNKDSTLSLRSLQDLTNPEISLIAIGDPAHMPAGEYAKQALMNAGLWEIIEPKTLPALDVRAVVAYVEKGEVEAGIAYRSDATVSEYVKVAFIVPEHLHEPITFLAAAIRNGKTGQARRFIDFVRSRECSEILKANGFDPISGN